MLNNDARNWKEKIPQQSVKIAKFEYINLKISNNRTKYKMTDFKKKYHEMRYN